MKALGDDRASSLVDALLGGGARMSRAEAVVFGALDEGATPAEVLVDVIPVALAEVGRRWQAGEITEADEHIAAMLVREILHDLARRLPRAPRRNALIVVSSIDGELHDVGGRILSDLLDADGWDCLYTGAATPADALAVLVQQRRPDVVALSATLSTHLPALRNAVERLRRDDVPPTHLVIGGQACAAQSVLDYVPADWCGSRADEAVAHLAQWVRTKVDTAPA